MQLPVEPSDPLTAASDRRAILARLEALLDASGELPEMSDARFCETHVRYEGASDQQARILEWFAARAPARASLDVLSVGCGSGILDVPLAEALARRSRRLRYVGVDPNPVECRAFETAFGEANLDGVEIAVHEATLEGFESTGRFDLVHLVHCLYYMPDPMDALRRARALVRPGGRLVAFHAPRAALNELAAPFYARTYARPTLFADALAERLDAEGWRYDRTRVEGWLDVTPCFVEGDPGGVALRDFVVQVDARRLCAEAQRLIAEYLRLVAVERDGRAWVAHPVDAFVVEG